MVPVLVLISAWFVDRGVAVVNLRPVSLAHSTTSCRPRVSGCLKFRPELAPTLTAVSGINAIAAGGIDVAQERDLDRAVHAAPLFIETTIQLFVVVQRWEYVQVSSNS